MVDEYMKAVSESYNHPAADGEVDGHKKSEPVADELGILLPCERALYSKNEVSPATETVKVCQNRDKMVEKLQADKSSINLWNAVVAFQGYPFRTSGRGKREGVGFKYTVSKASSNAGKHYEGKRVQGYGNEIMIEGREKSISRGSFDYALEIAKGADIKGPKELKIFGASYVYAIFKRFGLV